jgi:pilus assembly protein CpaF
MVLMAGYDLPVRAIRQQISSALDLLVHTERMRDGSRRVTSIAEVLRMESDVIGMQELFTFNPDGQGGGRLVSTGLRPALLEKFAMNGVDLPNSLFATDNDPATQPRTLRSAVR